MSTTRSLCGAMPSVTRPRSALSASRHAETSLSARAAFSQTRAVKLQTSRGSVQRNANLEVTASLGSARLDVQVTRHAQFWACAVMARWLVIVLLSAPI